MFYTSDKLWRPQNMPVLAQLHFNHRVFCSTVAQKWRKDWIKQNSKKQEHRKQLKMLVCKILKDFARTGNDDTADTAVNYLLPKTDKLKSKKMFHITMITNHEHFSIFSEDNQTLHFILFFPILIAKLNYYLASAHIPNYSFILHM